MCFIVDHSTTVIQHSNNNEYMSERELASYLKSFFFSSSTLYTHQYTIMNTNVKEVYKQYWIQKYKEKK